MRGRVSLGSVAFYFIAFVFGACGTLYGRYQYWDKVTNADLRVDETRYAVAEATKIGLGAERQYRTRHAIPTLEELNCLRWQRETCAEPAIISLREVRMDERGVIHATYHREANTTDVV